MKKDKVFYQSKFEHYRVMNMWIVIASCISSLFYVISDDLQMTLFICYDHST